MLPRRISRLILLAASILVPGAPFSRAAEAPSNAIGYDISLVDLPSPRPRPVPAPAADRAGPLPVLVRVPWGMIEKAAGVYDWWALDPIVVAHAEAGYAVVLEPHGGNAPLHSGGTADESDAAWTAFLGALAEHYRGKVAYYLIGRDVAALPIKEAAFRLKTSSVRIRSVDDATGIAVLLDADAAGAAERLSGLFSEGLAVYVDAVAASLPGLACGASPATDVLSGIRNSLLTGDPSASLWWVDTRCPGGLAASGPLLRAYLAGLAQEVDLALFQLDWEEGAPTLLPMLNRIRQTFLPEMSIMVATGRGIRAISPTGAPIAIATLRLYDAETKRDLLAYDGGEGAPRGAPAVLEIDTTDVADPALHDIAAGESGAAGGWQKDEQAGLTRVAVPMADYPLVLTYQRFTSPFFGEEETLEVSAERLPSVEEILAAHQAFQTAQDTLLVNLRADARVDYHFKIGQGTSFDVTIMSTFWYDPEVGAEFEQKEFLVNGVAWRSGRVPEFPLPEPEKVLTLPLDIALDKRYSYRLLGEDDVEGRAAWVIAFEPIVDAGSLYRGKVWIDKENYARLRVSSLQTGLVEPILSNDETDTYRPLAGPSGLTHYVLDRIEGQQIFSTIGRNLVLFREITFTNHVINDTGFEALRQQAYGSDHSILRETEKGYRFLDKTAGGERVVRDEHERDLLFLLGGVFYNRSFDFPVPLGGVNYFNSDLWGRGLQTNVFFAGVFAFGNLTDPDFLGSPFDASVDVVGQAIPGTDRPVVDGEEVEEENVEDMTQGMTVGIGLPFADHFKVKWTGSLEFDAFSRDEETSGDFLMPVDTLVASVGMQGEFNRRNWRARIALDVGRRQDWEPWGMPGSFGRNEDYVDATRDFVRYEGEVSKDWFLPYNQRLNASVTAYGGEDLDRFSKYRFEYFGNRLRGLSGAGYRYSDGFLGRAQYAFNLGEIIRFEASLDSAHVRDNELPPDGETGYNDFTGLGFSGQTIVGPNLIVTLDWGIVVASDVSEFRGQQEILVSLLRFFR